MARTPTIQNTAGNLLRCLKEIGFKVHIRSLAVIRAEAGIQTYLRFLQTLARMGDDGQRVFRDTLRLSTTLIPRWFAWNARIRA